MCARGLKRVDVAMGGTGFREYARLMFFHRQFRYLFASFVVTNAGNWLTYIASLRLIEKYAAEDRASLYVALFMVARLAPAVLCAPVAGVLADRVDRRVALKQQRDAARGAPARLAWMAVVVR